MPLKPQHIEKGDRIYLITPSGFATEEKINKAIENIKSLGLEVEHSEKIFSKYGYLAGTDEERLADLHYAFENPEIKAIFCIRGGYGATRLLDKIDYELIKKNPKIFIGFSDITALHSAFLTKTGLIGIHGIVGASNFSDYTRSQLENLLFTTPENYKLPCQNSEIISHGNEKGTLVGGNLSLLVSLIGTEFLPSFRNKIVFIEEIAEPPYKIDRMLTHLLMATDLKNANAFVFGTFNKCNPENFDIPPENSFTVKQIIEEKFSNFGKPVLYNVNFGHIDNACIFPIGVKTSIDTEKKEITILEKIVS